MGKIAFILACMFYNAHVDEEFSDLKPRFASQSSDEDCQAIYILELAWALALAYFSASMETQSMDRDLKKVN